MQKFFTISGTVFETAHSSFIIEFESLKDTDFRSWYRFEKCKFPFPVHGGDLIKVIKRKRNKQYRFFKIKPTRKIKDKMRVLFKELECLIDDDF